MAENPELAQTSPFVEVRVYRPDGSVTVFANSRGASVEAGGCLLVLGSTAPMQMAIFGPTEWLTVYTPAVTAARP